MSAFRRASGVRGSSAMAAPLGSAEGLLQAVADAVELARRHAVRRRPESGHDRGVQLAVVGRPGFGGFGRNLRTVTIAIASALGHATSRSDRGEYLLDMVASKSIGAFGSAPGAHRHYSPKGIAA
jgi:hypothetical protein